MFKVTYIMAWIQTLKVNNKIKENVSFICVNNM